MVIRQALGSLLVFALASPVIAGETSLRLLTIGLDTDAGRTVLLEPVSLRDLGVEATQGSSSSTLFAREHAGGLVVSGQPASLRQANLTVRRQVPIRWQVQVPASLRVARPQVRIDSEGPIGQSGVFVHGDGSSVLTVRPQPGTEIVVARDEQQEILEGEVWIEFALDQVRHAGSYSGRLVFTLEHL